MTSEMSGSEHHVVIAVMLGYNAALADVTVRVDFIMLGGADAVNSLALGGENAVFGVKLLNIDVVTAAETNGSDVNSAVVVDKGSAADFGFGIDIRLLRVHDERSERRLGTCIENAEVGSAECAAELGSDKEIEVVVFAEDVWTHKIVNGAVFVYFKCKACFLPVVKIFRSADSYTSMLAGLVESVEVEHSVMIEDFGVCAVCNGIGIRKPAVKLGLFDIDGNTCS